MLTAADFTGLVGKRAHTNMDSNEQERPAQADQTALASSGTDAGSGTEEQGDGEPSVSSPTQLDTAADASGGLSKAKRKGKVRGVALLL